MCVCVRVGEVVAGTEARSKCDEVRVCSSECGTCLGALATNPADAAADGAALSGEWKDDDDDAPPTHPLALAATPLRPRPPIPIDGCAVGAALEAGAAGVRSCASGRWMSAAPLTMGGGCC